MNTKKTFFCITILLFCSSILISGELKYSGVYQGKDLFLMNPMIEHGVSYCIDEVYINDREFIHTLKSSALRIAPAEYGLDYGESFEVIIRYKEGCGPTLVNPEVLRPLSTFELVDYELGYNNRLSFTTDNESGILKFSIEEFRWGAWGKVDEIDGKGGPGKNTYHVQLYPFNGNNRIRVYQENHLYQRNYSDEIVIPYETEPAIVQTNLRRVRDEIELSKETRYRVIDEKGNLILKGVGSTINAEELERGEYYLQYDNVFDVFRKR